MLFFLWLDLVSVGCGRYSESMVMCIIVQSTDISTCQCSQDITDSLHILSVQCHKSKRSVYNICCYSSVENPRMLRVNVHIHSFFFCRLHFLEKKNIQIRLVYTTPILHQGHDS